MEFLDCVKGRRSIRSFKAEQVPDEVLEQIVAAAADAPSWKNSQTTRYIAIQDPAVRQEAVEAILAQSTNMQELLERLLYIARSENGRTKARPAETELKPLCNELLQDFRMMHPERVFSLEGEGTAWCDAGMVRQILTILLDNAVKFTAEQGRITVALQGSTLRVTDDGVGMAPEVSSRIFERFFKGDSSHNEKGYGLGLPIAKLMCEQQGGTISVESVLGKGSTFIIQLPKNAEA